MFRTRARSRFICLVIAATAFFCAGIGQSNAAQSTSNSVPKISSHSQITNAQDGVGLAPNATNVAVAAFGRCRYIDSSSDAEFFIPLKTAFEWEAFIQNAPPTLTLSHCRTDYSVTHDFAGAPLTAAQRITGHLGVLDQGGGAYSDTALQSGSFIATFSYPLARSSALNEVRSNVVGYIRRDCRPNVTASGAVRDPAEVCSTAMWTETGRLRIRFTPASGSPRSLSNDAGAWTTQPENKLGVVPMFAPPANRTCPPQLHNQRTWIDNRTQTRAATLAECPYGPGTRRYERTEQLEYLCFDGTSEPTGASRNTAWQLQGGSCEEPPPSTGEWTVGSWGACSESCGGGTQTRNVSCSFDSCDGPEPVRTQTCNVQACACVTTIPWSASCADGGLTGAGSISGFTNWNSCTSAAESSGWNSVSNCCIAGQQSNVATQMHGATVVGCDGPPPVCTETSGGSQTTPCGGGFIGDQTRAVTLHAGNTCNNTQYGQWDRSACRSTGSWTVGAWGACSTTCGGGTQARAVSCAFDVCSDSQPTSTQVCNSQACPPPCDSNAYDGLTPGQKYCSGVSMYSAASIVCQNGQETYLSMITSISPGQCQSGLLTPGSGWFDHRMGCPWPVNRCTFDTDYIVDDCYSEAISQCQ